MLKSIFALAFCFLLFGGCSNLYQSNEYGLPQGAKDAAIKHMQDHCGVMELECKDIKISCASQLKISDADNANGIDEQWCIDVTCITRRRDSNEWHDLNTGWGYVYFRKNGNWEMKIQLCKCR